MAVDLSAIQWIEVIVALLMLLFTIVVFAFMVKFRALPFNKYWKTRAVFVASTFVWILSLLLARDQLWDASYGLFSVSDMGYHQLCQVNTLFTYGVSQPLFFIILLFMIRSKTNASNDLDLYNKHPNRTVVGWSFIWTLPLAIIHIIIIILNNASVVKEDTNFFWKTVDTETSCVVPLISTMAFICFYAIFLVSYIFYSNKFGKTLINKKLLRRLWWSQFFFALFFPFEVLLRFILTFFYTNFPVPAAVLSHIFFFIDLIVCLVGLLEFALLPVLDAAELPLYDMMADNLIEKRMSSRKSRSVEHAAIMLDVTKKSNSGVIITSSSTDTLALTEKNNNDKNNSNSNSNSNSSTTSSSSMPAYNSNISEQQSVEEFRKQMAKYSSNV